MTVCQNALATALCDPRGEVIPANTTLVVSHLSQAEFETLLATVLPADGDHSFSLQCSAAGFPAGRGCRGSNRRLDGHGAFCDETPSSSHVVDTSSCRHYHVQQKSRQFHASETDGPAKWRGGTADGSRGEDGGKSG